MPSRGWIRGSVRDLAVLVHRAAAPPQRIEELAKELEDGVRFAAVEFTRRHAYGSQLGANVASGHMVMHSEVANPGKEAEDQAHRFAGEFLAPAHQLEPQLRRLNIGRLGPLKMEWKISMQALVRRAQDVGAIDAGQYKSLMVQLSKSGYRTREPANLDPPVERPSRLFDMVKYFQQSMEFSPSELLALLNIGETDFWTYYRDPEDLLENILGPPAKEQPENPISELVGGLRLSAGAPPIHHQLKCAPEDAGQDQRLLDALHLLKREAILPERLVEVSEERVRRRIERNQTNARRNQELERLYDADYP